MATEMGCHFHIRLQKAVTSIQLNSFYSLLGLLALLKSAAMLHRSMWQELSGQQPVRTKTLSATACKELIHANDHASELGSEFFPLNFDRV